jgi:hypothetical protein
MQEKELHVGDVFLYNDKPTLIYKETLKTYRTISLTRGGHFIVTTIFKSEIVNRKIIYCGETNLHLLLQALKERLQVLNDV